MNHCRMNPFKGLRSRISSMERWRVNLYTIWFSQILSLMSFSFGIPFIPFYINELGVKDPVQLKYFVGLLSTAPAIASAVMAPVWGIAADKWGKKLMLLRAMAFGCFVMVGMSIATNVYHIVALRILQGVFTGTIAAATILVASNTPANKLSFALGFLASSTFIGSSAGPVIGGILAEYTGYRTSFIIGSLLMLADFFIVMFLVKEDCTENTEVSSAELSKKNAGSGKTDNTRVKVKTDAGQPLDDKKRRKGLNISFILKTSMLAMLFILFIIRVTRSVFSPYIPLFVQEMRSTSNGAARITGMINGVTGIMTALSGLTLSRLGDKYNKIRLLTVFFMVSIFLSIPLVFSKNLWIFTICYGVFYYIMGGIEPITVSVTAQNTPPERRGMLFGIQGFIGNMGMAIAPMIGSMISIRHSIHAILIMIPITLLPGFLMIFFIGRKNRNLGSNNGFSFED